MYLLLTVMTGPVVPLVMLAANDGHHAASAPSVPDWESQISDVAADGPWVNYSEVSDQPCGFGARNNVFQSVDEGGVDSGC